MTIKIFLTTILFQLCVLSQSQQLNLVGADIELNKKIVMASNRLVWRKEPEITEDLILTCVILDLKFNRRFTEFSGGQTGRYLSAFSKFKVALNTVDIQQLIKKIITTHKPDGKFGNDALIF